MSEVIKIAMVSDGEWRPWREVKASFERAYLIQLMRATHGHVANAGRLIDRPRADLAVRLRKHGIDPNDYRLKPRRRKKT